MTSEVGVGAGKAVPKPGPKPANFVSPRTVALYGILTALTAAVTYASYTPYSPTKGYFNLGESMVFFSALFFGFRAGAICGGVGSAAADLLLGSAVFAPITLVAKGLEGAVAGILGKNGKTYAIVLGIAVGGACMVTTYFLAEWLVLDLGFGKAIAEVPINIAQVALGGTIGALLSHYVRKAYPSVSRI
ncbi:MAG: ECF transporter S component [Thermoplasmata archaeon]|jgi:uncharacterized membrane protein|nr:ECF transporter S component [Thermoplasmata archaeon]